MSFETLDHYLANFDTDATPAFFEDSIAYNYKLEDVPEIGGYYLHDSYVLRLFFEHNLSLDLKSCEIKRCITSMGIVEPTLIKKTNHLTVSFNEKSTIIGIDELDVLKYKKLATRSIVTASIFRTVYMSFFDLEKTIPESSNNITINEQLERAQFLKKFIKKYNLNLPPAKYTYICDYINNYANNEAQGKAAVAGSFAGSLAREFTKN